LTRFSQGDKTASFRPDGTVRTLQSGGMTINHGVHGARTVVTERADHSRLVNLGAHRGYVEHSFQRNGRVYARRTYVVGGRTYVNVYRTHYYRGGIYYGYVPVYYYHPAFYVWAYDPWAGPVYYRWGWFGDPWYRPYGYYFTPYPVYPSATFWLTDYLIAENLRLAYEDQAAADADAQTPAAEPQGETPTGSVTLGPDLKQIIAEDSSAAFWLTDYFIAENLLLADENQAAADAVAQTEAAEPGGGTPSDSVALSPEVKQMIAEEVKRQLGAERQAAATEGTAAQAPASQEIPEALDLNHRVFIVATNLDVTVGGESCALTPGDVITRQENTPGSDDAVGISVLSSKKTDCGSGSLTRVQVSDLQEMQNRFREQIDSGLKMLAENQGKGGLPRSPAAKPRLVAEGQAAPDLTAKGDLQQQQQDANKTESEVQQAARGDKDK
jgi:hypothetical protein